MPPGQSELCPFCSRLHTGRCAVQRRPLESNRLPPVERIVTDTSPMSKRRRWLVSAASVGFCVASLVTAGLIALRLHLTGYPEKDVESDLVQLPFRVFQSGVAGAWIAGLVAYSTMQPRGRLWSAAAIVLTPALVAMAIVDSRIVAVAIPFQAAPLLACLAGAALGAGIYRWFALRNA